MGVVFPAPPLLIGRGAGEATGNSRAGPRGLPVAVTSLWRVTLSAAVSADRWPATTVTGMSSRSPMMRLVMPGLSAMSRYIRVLMSLPDVISGIHLLRPPAPDGQWCAGGA